MHEIETFMIAHKDLITLFFTLVLILTSLVSVIIAVMSVREIRKQCLFQELICLRNIFHSSQLALSELGPKAATAANEQQGVAIDEAIASLKYTINRTQKRITQIEFKLGIKWYGESKKHAL